MKNLKTIFYGLAIVFVTVSLASCNDGEDEPTKPSITDGYVSKTSGEITLTVADQFSYSTEITVTIVAGENETISVTFPKYSLAGTMMGDMTLGDLTIDGLTYDDAKGGFFRSYGGDGLTQHFKSENHGTSTMDSDYPLNEPSSILVKLDDNGKIIIENPFTLGKMPMPLAAHYEGEKK